MMDSNVLDPVLNRARSVTGARMVAVSRYDSVTGMGSVVAVSWPHSRAFLQAVEAAKRFFPGFDPVGFTFHVSSNGYTRAVYLEGESVAAPLEELAKDILSPRLIRIAVQLGGLRHTLACPLKVRGRVRGSVAFYAGRPLGQRIAEFERFVIDELMMWEGGLLPGALGPAGASAPPIPEAGGDVTALSAHKAKGVWRFFNLTVDMHAGAAFLGSSRLELTDFEFALLVCLVRRPLHVVPHEVLACRVATTSDAASQRLVDLTVHHLRQKLERGGSARLIHPVRGAGYTLREDGSA
jgi:hypothetical protein